MVVESSKSARLIMVVILQLATTQLVLTNSHQVGALELIIMHPFQVFLDASHTGASSEDIQASLCFMINGLGHVHNMSIDDYKPSESFSVFFFPFLRRIFLLLLNNWHLLILRMQLKFRMLF